MPIVYPGVEYNSAVFIVYFIVRSSMISVTEK